MTDDLLIFDCDGVLVDSELLAIRALRDVLTEAGVPVEEAQVLGCFGMKQADTLRHLADITGHAIPPEVPARIWPATRRAFEASLGAMPGVVALLAALPSRLGRCVASSSHPERIHTSLGLTGLAPWFGPHVFSAQQVAHGKPAPDLFLLAATRMGVRPERCIVVEDSLFGVQAARAAGMTAIGFVGGSHIAATQAAVLAAAGAVLVTRDWAEVARCVDG